MWTHLQEFNNAPFRLTWTHLQAPPLLYHLRITNNRHAVVKSLHWHHIHVNLPSASRLIWTESTHRYKNVTTVSLSTLRRLTFLHHKYSKKCALVSPGHPKIFHSITKTDYNIMAVCKDLISVTLLAPVHRRYYRGVKLAVYEWL
jgi:hypothetical protein